MYSSGARPETHAWKETCTQFVWVSQHDGYIYMKRGGEYVRTYYSIYTYQYMCVNKALPKRGQKPQPCTCVVWTGERESELAAQGEPWIC